MRDEWSLTFSPLISKLKQRFQIPGVHKAQFLEQTFDVGFGYTSVSQDLGNSRLQAIPEPNETFGNELLLYTPFRKWCKTSYIWNTI